ncbi:type VI secretion system protein ImpK [Archangium gephyra]|uniref:Type VI secretion system protein ImpK n=1 Tax=Archangium gephyra TaxID=48 RepID=A0ABX9JXG2_9BACT|nr:DotU family type IV/VI secretion system protein [Archangium gephyra]REG28827.1 type VI secretion system protein ImpK [Archangium gephyra]
MRNPTLSTDSELLGGSPLLERARVLFAELLRLRQQLQAISLPSRFNAKAPQGPTVEEVWRRLLERIREQTRTEGTPRGSLLERDLEECRYVLTSFADELLVHTPWYGREAWQGNLLEDELFGTHEAGDRIFADVERLLRERDPAHAQLALVYLMALSLGFEGRYRGLGAGTLLQDLQRQLFLFVFQRPPEPDTATHRLVDEAYAHTRDERTDLRFARRWPWGAAIAAVLVGTLSTSLVLLRPAPPAPPAVITPTPLELRP